jgi:ariadne-1
MSQYKRVVLVLFFLVVGDSTRAHHTEGIRYNVLTQDDLCVRLEVDTHKVRELLSIAPGLAAVLLRHCQWRPERVQSGWFDNREAFCGVVGLPSSEDDVSGPRVLTGRTPNCLCFDSRAGWAVRSAGCSHYYCDECWHRYIRVEMDEGPRCLPLQCSDPFCDVPVVRELVIEVVHDADTMALYDHFMLRLYVDDSGGRIKWCQGHGCSRAVEFIGGGHGDSTSTDVVCECRHGFC